MATNNQNRKNCIEAGHGFGNDPGAVNRATGRRESDDTFRITQATNRELRALGYDVTSSRTSTNINGAAPNRVAIARQHGAVCFVEFHMNDAVLADGRTQNTQVHGFETFTRVKFSAADDRLARAVHEAIVKVGVQRDRGVKRKDFGRAVDAGDAGIPYCLVEVGFIGNTEDNRLFDRNCDAYAKAVAGAIARLYPISSTPAPPNPPTPPMPPTTNTTFRVIAGSYKMRSNVDKQRVRLVGLGFKDSFLHSEPVNGVPMFRVVVGSFRERDNANRRLAELKRAGINNGFLVAARV